MRLDFKGFELKSLDDSQGEGVFSGYASTWDKDLYDDVIVKGAFAGTLENDYGGTGAGIPIHWQHKDDKPTDIIGETLSAVEDEHGLLVTARLDLDLPEGKRAYDLLKRGLIHQMSIGFLAEETAFVQDGSSRVQRSLTRPIFGSVRKPHLHPSACPTLNRADLVNSADCSPSLRLLYRGTPVRRLFPVRRLVTIWVLPAL